MSPSGSCERVLTVAASGPKIPRAPVHDVATLVWGIRSYRLSPHRPSIASLQPNRIHSLLVTPWWIKGRKTKITKPAIACGERVLRWCPRQDSNAV